MSLVDTCKKNEENLKRKFSKCRLVDTCKKNKENLKENFLSVGSRHLFKNEENSKENFLSVV